MKKFEFTYKNKDFLLNGKPYRVLSGAIHYWRVVPEYWEDRLKKLRACGFNTVETYIAWNLHERREGVFDFSGNLNVVKFIETAESLGLNVIIRPGPYICSEFDFGGLPSWLLAYPDIRLRCNDERYLEKVRPYYRELLSRIRPHLCTNGGKVIMVQIENEYGSYGDDREYLEKVAGMYREYGIDCLLYTADGPSYWMLNGGTLPEYPAVANFGSHAEQAFELLSDFRSDQPSMCGEFWCGWFDHWGEEHHTRTAEDTVADLDSILKCGASVNFYMFHGGTNFGFTNGANHNGQIYQPTVTSYDYCAPLSEAGDMTETFFAVRKCIAENTGKPMPEIDVENTPKAAYGKLELTESAVLFENIGRIGKTYRKAAVLSMEEVGQDFGYILYSSVIHGPCEELDLVLEEVHDRALIYIDGKFAGVFERDGYCDNIKIKLGRDQSLKIDILVENMGRINYGPKLLDKKGIIGGVRLGQQYHFGWDITTLTMNDLSGLDFVSGITESNKPEFLRGILNIDTPADTFVRLDGLHKGFVVVNGFNIGRYWNDRGPQKTLYIPAPILKKGKNEIIVFESDSHGDDPVITFCDTPEL